MPINLDLLTKAMQDGDTDAIQKELGTHTIDVIGRVGELERINAELVKKIAWLRTQVPEWKAAGNPPEHARYVLVFMEEEGEKWMDVCFYIYTIDEWSEWNPFVKAWCELPPNPKPID